MKILCHKKRKKVFIRQNIFPVNLVDLIIENGKEGKEKTLDKNRIVDHANDSHSLY